MLNKGEEKKH